MKYLVLLVIVGGTVGLPRSYLKVSGGGKIVGGEEAGIGEFPHQVSVLYGGRHICGGSLIATDAVLTAAHCMIGSARNFQAVVGQHNQKNASEAKQVIDCRNIFVHPQYNKPSQFANDIAIMMLSEEVEITDTVDMICLPPPMAESRGIVTVSGWGSTFSGGSVTDELRRVDLPIVGNPECQRMYSDEDILESMLCAGYPEGGKDSCQGDSGGPLESISPESDTYGCVVGIVSWGYGCAAPGYPGVNTHVSHYSTWINEHINGTFV